VKETLLEATEHMTDEAGEETLMAEAQEEEEGD